MSKYAIQVSGLGKSYTIGAYQGRYKSLRDSLTQAITAPLRRLKNGRGADADERTLWALKDVDFNIEHGEVVGIIGRNGAGKSTLLKLLARITEPTTGEIRMRGRVGSLLEVGTGFHPELTGRENIFLNGAILGMSRKEIERKFDEIVDFAEIEKFIDTPAKHYSSGMYMRLAFAVAAHLEPEILLVDEVLAVGDAQFQKKCLGKMGDVAKEGRTVLFVSHNMEAIVRICKKTVLLSQGKIQKIGDTNTVINSYLRSDYGTTAYRMWDSLINSPGNNIAKLKKVFVTDINGITKENYKLSEAINIVIEYEVLEAGHILHPAFNFTNEKGINIFDSHNVNDGWLYKSKPIGCFRSTVTISKNLLTEGVIVVGAAIITPDPFIIHFHEQDAVAFVASEDMDIECSEKARGRYAGSFPGLVRPLFPWVTEII